MNTSLARQSKKQQSSPAYDDTLPIQRLYHINWKAWKGEWTQVKQGKNLLEPVLSEEEAKPGQEYYIRGGETNNYYQTILSNLVHIDDIREFIRLKRIWRKK